ncbi:MAG: hypothetical protein N2578_05610, partial [Bdellovibrionaceae bacterium]|nr:hypothetical protein [Pseudobdellovibrionaceae bacterium]
IILPVPVDLAALGIKPAEIVNEMEFIEIRKNKARLLVVSVNPMAEISNNDTKKKAELDNWSFAQNYITSRSTSRVQPNDSGAPVYSFVNGRWKILAVVKGRAKTLFTDWDVFTLLR